MPVSCKLARHFAVIRGRPTGPACTGILPSCGTAQLPTVGEGSALADGSARHPTVGEGDCTVTWLGSHRLVCCTLGVSTRNFSSSSCLSPFALGHHFAFVPSSSSACAALVSTGRFPHNFLSFSVFAWGWNCVRPEIGGS